MLGSILTLAATSNTAAHRALLPAFYSLGLGVPFLVTSLLAARATALFKRFNRFLPALEAAILIFTDRFTVFNQTFQQLGIDRFGVL